MAEGAGITPTPPRSRRHCQVRQALMRVVRFRYLGEVFLFLVEAVVRDPGLKAASDGGHGIGQQTLPRISFHS